MATFTINFPYTTLSAGVTFTALSGAIPGAVSANDLGVTSGDARIRDTSAVAGSHVGARRSFTATNLTGKFLSVAVTSAVNVIGRFATIANNGLSIAVFDGAGNWAEYTVGGSDSNPNWADNALFPQSAAIPPFHFVIEANAPTINRSSGVVDWSNIVAIEFLGKRAAAETQNLQWFVDRIGYFSRPILTQGDIATPGDFGDFISTLASNSSYRFILNPAGASEEYGSNPKIYSFFPGLEIGNGVTATRFVDSFATLLAYPDFSNSSANAAYHPNGSTKIIINASASDYVEIRNSQVSALQNLDVIIQGNSGATVLLDSNTLNSLNQVNAAFGTFRSGRFQDLAQEFNLATGITLESAIISSSDSGAAIVLEGGTLSDCTIQNSASAGVRIPSAGDYSTSTATLNNNGTYDVYIEATVVDGETVDISGFEFAEGSTTPTNIYWAGTTGEIVVTVSQAGLSTDSAGGTITLAEPAEDLAITGFPTTNNANGIAPNPVLGILDASDESWITGFDTSSPEYNGDGSFTILPSNYLDDLSSGTSIYIVGDAVGWRRTPLIEIDISDPPSEFNIGNNFEELTDQDGSAIVGNSTACTGLSYSQPNARFELASDSGGASNHYDFDGVVYQQELLTSNLLGLQNFDTDTLRQIRYISNPRYKQIILPPMLSISATEDATTSPIVADFTVIRIDGTDPFEHGLDSTAVGLSDRPEVRVNFQVAIALDPEQVTWLETLYNATESGTGLTAFSTTALANAPSGGGGGSGDATAANQTTIINHLTDIKGPTWTTTDSLEAIRDRGDIAWITATGFSTLVQADIRSALGISSANLDTQLGNIPTVAEFEARTLPSANYFNFSTDQVIVATNNDKLGYSLTQVFPSNFELLGINENGHIDQVTLVDTTTTNSDMRGTDNAFLAASYVVPDNTSITAIKSKTDQLTFTIANQVDSNAVTGGGGEDATTIYNYFTSDSRQDTFKADVSGLSTFNVAEDEVTANLSNSSVAAIWDYLTSTLTTVGSIGKYLVDNLLGIKQQTDQISFDVDGNVLAELANEVDITIPDPINANITQINGVATDLTSDISGLSTDITTLLGRLTDDRAGYLDKLNVVGTLANTDNASSFIGFNSIDRDNLIIIKSEAVGQVIIDEVASTMTIYNSETNLPLAVFDLQDSEGVASTEKIFRRLPQ